MKYIWAGDSLTLDTSRCLGDGRCLEVCPHGVLALTNHKAIIADRSRCMQCGACQKNCPTGAIQVSTGVGCAALLVKKIRRGKKGDAECECR